MEEVQEEEEAPKATSASLLRDRIIFYTSLILIIFGGLYFALGSYLHDFLRVPVIGTAYTIFGPVNVLFAGIGLLLLLVGFALLALSLRGGVLSNQEVERLKAEGELP